MSGSNQQQQSQQSVSQPWAPAVPYLRDLMGRLGTQSTDVTQGQQAGLNTLQQGANMMPGFGSQTAGVAGQNIGTNFGQEKGMIGNALSGFDKNMATFASPNWLDPSNNKALMQSIYGTPGMPGSGMVGQGEDQLKSMYAASGRDPTGAGNFGKSFAQWEGQSIAPMLAGQFNQNVGTNMAANQGMFGAGTQAAGMLTNEQLQQINAQNQGIQQAGAVPGMFGAPLGAANQAFGQPWQNLMPFEQGITPIAALGGQTSGTGTTTTTPSTWSTLGGLGMMGASLPWSSIFASDERVKRDVRPIGWLNDGLPLYKFNYVWDELGVPPHIGVMAQDVEQVKPAAVVEIGNIKHVDYNQVGE